MRMILAAAIVAVTVLAPPLALAQEQQEASLVPPGSAGGQPVFDMVAADRETAWRINRVTGEVTICRIDATGGLDSVRARCAPATIQQGGGAQQSQAPAAGGAR